MNINYKMTSLGFTPIALAAKEGWTDTVEALLRYNADPNVTTCDGLTPLHIAIIKNRKDIFLALLKHDVKVNIQDKYGRTPMHLAVSLNSTFLVLNLLESGANLFLEDYLGQNCIQLAARSFSNCYESINAKILKQLDFSSSVELIPPSAERDFGGSFNIQHDSHNSGIICSYNCQWFPYIPVEISEIFEAFLCRRQYLNFIAYLPTETHLLHWEVNMQIEYAIQKEMKTMWDDKVCVGITFRDILVKPLHVLAPALKRNKSFRNLRCFRFNKYPIFKVILKQKLWEIQEYNELYVNGHTILNNSTNIFLPHLVARKIFSYLAYLDLKNLLWAAEK